MGSVIMMPRVEIPCAAVGVLMIFLHVAVDTSVSSSISDVLAGRNHGGSRRSPLVSGTVMQLTRNLSLTGSRVRFLLHGLSQR